MKPASLIASLVLLGCNSASVPKPTATELFDLRTKCESLVNKRFEGKDFDEVNDFGSDASSFVVSHYNSQTTHCYALVTSIRNDHPDGDHSSVLDRQVENLFDAQTAQVLMKTKRDHGKSSAVESNAEGLDVIDYNTVDQKIKKLMSQD